MVFNMLANRYLLIIGMLLILCGCASRSISTPSAATTLSTQGSESEVMTEKIREESEEALNEGKGVVGIDLDEDPVRVQQDDLVQVNYTASLQTGEIFYTTLPYIGDDPDRRKVVWYEKPTYFAPEAVLAGAATAIPGVGNGIVGMAVGESKTITLPPEKAYGFPDPRNMTSLPCVRRIPKIMRMSAADYVSQFRSFPILGKEVNLTPYFKARVIKITEHYAALESLVTDDERIQEDFGTADIRVTGDEITVTLTPKIGAFFEINGRKGRLTQAEDTSFTVDFNHLLAGHAILLDMEVVTLTKASALRDITILWQEDHDAAFLAAGREEKPMVLVLYADWCQWSKRLLSEVFEDPRIKILRDRFVWAKVNSYKYSEYKDLYGQNGFPMVVLMNREGSVVTKLDGFRDAKTVRQALDQLIHRDTPMLSSR